MANGGQIDIIVAKKAIDEVNLATKDVDELNNSIIAVSKSVIKLNANFAIKTSKGLDERLKKNAEAQKTVAANVEKVRLAEIKLAQNREKAFDKFTAQKDKERKVRLKETDAIKRNKIALDKQRKSMTETSRAYKQLSLRSVEARKKAQDLGAAYGVTSKRFKTAAAEANRLNSRLKKIDASTGVYTRSVGNYGNALRGAVGFTRQMVSALGLMGGAFLAVQVIRGAFNTIKEFNKESAVLASVLQKTTKEIKPLTKNAKELGATTAKTANEIIGLQVAFARLGFTQQEILSLTEATIEGSIAMNSQLDETANLVGAMVNSFDDFSATDAPEIIDILSLATAKSALNFQKLEKGLPIVAGAANAAGIPFTKLTALLGKLADSGIDVSSSATALRNIFIESAKQGLNYSEIIQKIKDSQDTLTAANDQFGKRAAVSASILSNNIDLTNELDIALQNAGGTAKRMAEQQLDTLAGSLTLLESAWKGFILSVEDGEGAFSKAIRGMVDSLSDLFNALTDINEVTSIIPSIELAGGGGASSAGFFGTFVNFFKNTGKARAQLKLLNEDFKELRSAGVEELTQAYGFYDEMLSKVTDPVRIKLIEFQLKRIEDLVIVAKKLEEANKGNEEQNEDLNETIGISIASLRELIKTNNELISATDDDTLRRRLLGENALIKKQIDLLLEVPKAVKAIKTVGAGILTVEGEKRRKAPKTTETALRGGGGGAGDFLGITDPTLFDVDGVSAFETAVSDVTSFVDTYDEQIGQAIDVTNAFFDNRIERIDQDIEANNRFFDNQIALAVGNDEEIARLERERQKKDTELQKKKQKEVEKQAVFNKAIAVTNIVLDTAQAVAKAIAASPLTAGLPFSAIVAALGAAQIATVLATPIPKFKEGIESAPKGLAVVGDGGKHEFIETPQGIFQTPDTDTLVNFKGGERVHKDLDNLVSSKGYDYDAISKAAIMTSIINDGIKLSVSTLSESFDMNLNKYQGQIKKEIKQGLKGFKNINNNYNNFDYEFYKNDGL